MSTGGCSDIGPDAEISISGNSDGDEPIPGRLPDVLQVLAGLEADSPPGWDANFLTGARVTADAAFPRLHLEHSEPAQLNPIASLHRHSHRIEHRIDGYL